MNIEKSKDAQPVPESETITIASQAETYKLTFDIKQSNGYNPKYDIVTDMNGAPGDSNWNGMLTWNPLL